MRGLYVLVGLLVLSFTSFAQSDGDYQSRQTGNWSNPTTWQVFNSGWVNLEDAGAGIYQNIIPDFNSGLINIRNTHTVSVDLALVADDLTIDTGGILDVTAGNSLDFPTFLFADVFFVNGTLNNHGTFTAPSFSNVQINGTFNAFEGSAFTSSDQSSFFFNTNSNYNHLLQTTGGEIPLATWDASSTCTISGYTSNNTSPVNISDQSFGNLVLNFSSWVGTSPFQLGLTNGSNTEVQGNFTIVSTGSARQIAMNAAASGYTFAVRGNFQINAGVLLLQNSAATGNFSVDGTFTLGGGNVVLSQTNASAVANLTLNGSFSRTTTTGTVARGSNGTSAVIFAGNPSTATLTQNGTAAAFAGAIAFSVSANRGINFQGEANIAGTGSTFTMNSGSTIGLSSTNSAGAYQLSTTAGNIRVTATAPSRTLSNTAVLRYNGTAAQFIGADHPTNVATEINNSNGVTVSSAVSSLTFGRTFTQTSGNLSLGAGTVLVTFNSNVTQTGSTSIVVNANSSVAFSGTGTVSSFRTSNGGGTPTIANLTINWTSTIPLSNDLVVDGTFTQTAGDLNIQGRSFTIGGDYSRAAGNLLTNASTTLIVNGLTTAVLPATFAFGSSTAIGTLTMARATQNLSTSATLTITTLNLNGGTVTQTGNIAIASGGTLRRQELGSLSQATNNSATPYVLVYDIASNISSGPELPNNITLTSLTKLGSGTLTISPSTFFTINGALTLSSGTFNVGSNTFILRGNFVSDAPSVLTSSNIALNSTTALTTISNSPVSPTFGNVNITGSGSLTANYSFGVNGIMTIDGTFTPGTSTVTFGGTASIVGSGTKSFNNVTISGTLTAPTGNMNVAGTWTNNGTFTRGANTNTVTFNGTSTITGLNPTVFSGITISGTLTSPANLHLAGNFTNNGTFNHNSGEVDFEGSTLQLIQGSTTTTFNNISITNVGGPPGVRATTNANLLGTLTLGSGAVFDPDGAAGTTIFTLVSSADSPTVDAAIATLPTGAKVDGNVTVQRYMTIEGANSARIYRYISSPVKGTAVSQIQTEIPVTGSFTGASTCTGCGTSASMFLYNETVTTDTDGSGIADFNDGYVAFPSAASTDTLARARGYAIFVRGNIAPVSTAGNARWDVRGLPYAGNVNFVSTGGVSFTSSGNASNDGWNLVGNPYPSTIDWDAAAGWTRTNINNAIYMKDNGQTSPVYATYVGGSSTNGATRYIPIGQAFFVKASAAGITFTADERVKVGGTQTEFFKTAAPSDQLRIALRQGTVSDETIIKYNSDATSGFDNAWDAYKLPNQVFNLFSQMNPELKLAINTMPSLTCSSVVPLHVTNAPAGTYQLNFSEFESFASDVLFRLTDNFTQQTIDVKANPTYFFTINADNISMVERFTMIISKQPIVTELALTTADVCAGTDVNIQVAMPQNGVAYAAYINNERVSDFVQATTGPLSITVPGSKLTLGNNSVVVKGGYPSCDPIPVGNLLTVKYQPVVSTLTVTGAVNCGPGALSLKASGTPDGGTYRWYSTEDATEPIAGATSALYSTPQLEKTKTYYVSSVNALGCEGGRTAVIAQISYAYDIATVSNAQVCPGTSASLGATGAPNDGKYNWYVLATSAEPIPGQNGSTFQTGQLTESRTYYVSVVNAAGCEGTRVAVTASVLPVTAASLTREGALLRVNATAGIQWYLNNTKIEGATAQTYRPSESGVYKVVITSGPCSSTAETEYVVTGLGDLHQEDVSLVYPNPTSGKVFVEVRSESDVEVAITNPQGARVAGGILKSEAKSCRGEFDLSHQSSGLYLLSIKSGNNTIWRKVIKN